MVAAFLFFAALALRNAAFLLIGLATLLYTSLLCGMLVAQARRLEVGVTLKHQITTLHQPNMISYLVRGYSPAGPLLLSVEPVVPPYIVRRHEKHGNSSVALFFEGTRKGQYGVGGCQIILQDSLRLFRIHMHRAPSLTVTVIPRPLPIDTLGIALTAPVDGQRVRYAPNVDPSQLTGTHPYQNEPISRIHWKMSAHTGKLTVKDFAPSASKTVILLADYTMEHDSSFPPETLDDTLSVAAASILQYIQERKLPFGLVTSGSQLAWTGIGHDRRHLLSCFTAIAQAQVASGSGKILLDWLDRTASVLPLQSQLILLSHRMAEPEVVYLLKQRNRFAHIMVVLFPEGTFLLPGEHRAPYYLHDTAGLGRLRSMQRVLRQNGIDLFIIGLNDPLAMLSLS